MAVSMTGPEQIVAENCETDLHHWHMRITVGLWEDNSEQNACQVSSLCVSLSGRNDI